MAAPVPSAPRALPPNFTLAVVGHAVLTETATGNSVVVYKLLIGPEEVRWKRFSEFEALQKQIDLLKQPSDFIHTGSLPLPLPWEWTDVLKRPDDPEMTTRRVHKLNQYVHALASAFHALTTSASSPSLTSEIQRWLETDQSQDGRYVWPSQQLNGNQGRPGAPPPGPAGAQPQPPGAVTHDLEAQRRSQELMATLLTGNGWTFVNPSGHSEYWKFYGTFVNRRLQVGSGITKDGIKSDQNLTLTNPIVRLGARTVEFTLISQYPPHLLAKMSRSQRALWDQHNIYRIVCHVPEPLPPQAFNSNQNQLLLPQMMQQPARLLTIDYVGCSDFYFGASPYYQGCGYANPMNLQNLSPADLAAYHAPVNSRTFVEGGMPGHLRMTRTVGGVTRTF